MPLPEADEHQRLGEAVNARGGAQGGEAVGRDRAVEEPEQPEDGGLYAPAIHVKPPFVDGKDAEPVRRHPLRAYPFVSMLLVDECRLGVERIA